MAAAMAAQARASSRPSTITVASVSGFGQHLDGDVGHGGERAPGAGQHLAHVVAGDVLHHAAARLDGLGAAGHRGDAEEMVARGAGLDAARAGQIGRDRAADGALAGRAAEQRAIVHRLEGELLVVLVQQRLDLGQRRAGFGREHQFFRLVQRDAGKPRQIERQVGLARPAEPALGALPRHLQRLVVAERPAHGVLDLLGVAGFQVFSVMASKSSNTSFGTNFSESRNIRERQLAAGNVHAAQVRRSGAAPGTPCRD